MGAEYDATEGGDRGFTNVESLLDDRGVVAAEGQVRHVVREDLPDRIFTTRTHRDAAVCAEIARAYERGRPVLLATTDVVESERFADLVAALGVPATVLNARNDAEEAAIVAEAGALGAVTISTQMTGRGVDIRLGGHEQHRYSEVAALGGLYVIGVEHHDSRRVDDQVRGRAGRQGDPGTTVFYVSLEDDLVQRIPAEVRDTLEDLFRAKFTLVRRVPRRALKPQGGAAIAD